MLGVADAMVDDPVYGRLECHREGFPGMAPGDFVEFFCSSHAKCRPESIVTRLEFKKVTA